MFLVLGLRGEGRLRDFRADGFKVFGAVGALGCLRDLVAFAALFGIRGPTRRN